MEQLSPTAYVILGMVRKEPRSGYEIKAAGRRDDALLLGGQLRADLPGAEAALRGRAGGRASTPPPAGGKRTVYEITADGEEELKAWLRQPPSTFEMREEGLLKLFFADALPREEAVEILRAMRAHRARRPRAAARDGAEGGEKDGPVPADRAAGRDRVHRVVRRLVRADGGADPRRPLPRKGAADVRLPRPPRRRQRPPRSASSRSPSSCSPARSAARSPAASTPTAPTTRRPRR